MTESGRTPSENPPRANLPKGAKEISEVLLIELIKAYEELYGERQEWDPDLGVVQKSPDDPRYQEAVRWVNRQEFFDRELAEEEELNDDSVRR